MGINAQDMFEELGYIEYDDSENYDYYTNYEKGLTIEIRKYINEYVKYETKSKKRRGINAKEHQAITQSLKELGWL